jgi:hypothetical protein
MMVIFITKDMQVAAKAPSWATNGKYRDCYICPRTLREAFPFESLVELDVTKSKRTWRRYSAYLADALLLTAVWAFVVFFIFFLLGFFLQHHA